MTAEHLPTIFRGRTPDEASEAAKVWARFEGLRVRTIATIRRREDFPDWPSAEDPGASLHAYEVVLVVDMPDAGILPDPPTLTLWETAV